MNIRTIANIVFAEVVLSIVLISQLCAAQQAVDEIKPPALIMKNPAGETVSLAAYLGKKPVLMVFWASWCTICRDEIPLLKKLNADSFKVIAVNEGESAWKAKRFIAMNDIDYLVVLDSDGSVAKAFHVPGVPACAIINKSGLIAYRGMSLPENIDAYTGK